MSVSWFGNEWLEKFKQDRLKKLQKACVYTTNQIKRELGTKSPPPSAPGDPPHLETGELRRSFTWEVDANNLVGRCGTNKKYARHLAKGTSKMEERDLFAGYTKNVNQIIAILKGK